MTRALVIGGRGYYGARVVSALERVGGLEVVVASRSAADPAARVDLCAPDTFAALDAYDLIVNCSDTVGAPPDEAIRHTLARGGHWLDMGADAPTAERLLALEQPDARGTAVVGVGIFPGLSTALAAQVARAVDGCERVEVAVRFSPISGAGPGNVALMTESLQTPAYRYEGGVRVEAPAALGAEKRFDYAGAAGQPALEVAMPDTALVHRATQAPDVASYLAVVPSFLRFNFRVLVGVMRLLGPLRRVLLWLTHQSMVLTRAMLLRGRSSSVQLTVEARGASGEVRARRLSFPDGQAATALGVAAAVDCLLRLPEPPPRGVQTIADVADADALLAAARTLGGPEAYTEDG